MISTQGDAASLALTELLLESRLDTALAAMPVAAVRGAVGHPAPVVECSLWSVLNRLSPAGDTLTHTASVIESPIRECVGGDAGYTHGITSAHASQHAIANCAQMFTYV